MASNEVNNYVVSTGESTEEPTLDFDQYEEYIQLADGVIVNKMEYERSKYKSGSSKRTTGDHCCDQCNFKAGSNSSLEVHRIIRHLADDQIKWFQCDQCDYQAKMKKTLTRHKARKHSNIQDNVHIISVFQCNKCDYLSNNNYSISRHLRRFHSKENAGTTYLYKCSKCAFIAKTRTYLVGHLKLVHHIEHDVAWFDSSYQTERTVRKMTVQKITVIKKIVKAREDFPNDRIKFRCDLCDYQAPFEKTLQFHKICKHSNTKITVEEDKK